MRVEEHSRLEGQAGCVKGEMRIGRAAARGRHVSGHRGRISGEKERRKEGKKDGGEGSVGEQVRREKVRPERRQSRAEGGGRLAMAGSRRAGRGRMAWVGRSEPESEETEEKEEERAV